MQLVSYSLSHRGPPATRTRARWQPYNTLPTISTRSPSVTVNTPSSPSSSYIPSLPTVSCDLDVLRHQTLSVPPPLRDTHLRDPHKSKYVVGLVDQAVRSLCEMWHPHDIPQVFLTASRSIVQPSSDVCVSSSLFPARNTQLPSPPISPRSQPSPPFSTYTSTRVPHPMDTDAAYPSNSQSNLVPIKGFVHEVLRRSRTSGTVLQTALCYLEAIRSKVPDLVEQEKSGQGIRGEPQFEDRITLGDSSCGSDAYDLDNFDAMTKTVCDAVSAICCDDTPETVRSNPLPLPDLSQPGLQKKPKTPSGPLPPLPPLPSPLLCPRRTFLASLILASKFTQDRCYSNRAWAKLSGLPPREIGRCERALGEALEWRLWVGKAPLSSDVSSSGGRAVVRCRSEGDLFAHAKVSPSFRRLGAGTSYGGVPLRPIPARRSSGLQRSVTVPAEEFAAMRAVPPLDFDPLTTPLPPFGSSSMPMSTFFSDSPYKYPPLSRIHLDSQGEDPSPLTPSLSLSPTSTDSSGGDRTIQMSSFMELSSSPSMSQVNVSLFSKMSRSDPYSVTQVVVNPAMEGSYYGPYTQGGNASLSNWTM